MCRSNGTIKQMVVRKYGIPEIMLLNRSKRDAKMLLAYRESTSGFEFFSNKT